MTARRLYMFYMNIGLLTICSIYRNHSMYSQVMEMDLSTKLSWYYEYEFVNTNIDHYVVVNIDHCWCQHYLFRGKSNKQLYFMFKHCVIMCEVKRERENIESINFNKYSYKIAMVVKSLSCSTNQTIQMIVTLNIAYIYVCCLCVNAPL